MSVTVSYKGAAIQTISGTATKTLKTAGKYCEGDIVLQNVESGGITTEALSITQNGTYTAPSGKAYTPVTVNVESGGGADVYEAINRATNVNVADENLSTVMARGIYAGTTSMSAGDALTAGVIYIQYEE